MHSSLNYGSSRSFLNYATDPCGGELLKVFFFLAHGKDYCVVVAVIPKMETEKTSLMLFYPQLIHSLIYLFFELSASMLK